MIAGNVEQEHEVDILRRGRMQRTNTEKKGRQEKDVREKIDT